MDGVVETGCSRNGEDGGQGCHWSGDVEEVSPQKCCVC